MNKYIHRIPKQFHIYARNLYTTLTNLIAPPTCAHCKLFLSQRDILCERCIARIKPVMSVTIPVTQKYAMKVMAVSAYQDPIKSLILAKGGGNIVASTQLGTLIWDMTYLRHARFDYIVPIPLHWTRQAHRGFNQAEEIANIIAEKSGKKVVHLLKRTKRTKFQSSVSGQGRHENVKNAFAFALDNINDYKNKRFLLVDDLMTTGSTLKAAARELIKLKPLSLVVVVAARTT